MQSKVNLPIMVEEWQFMEKVCGVLEIAWNVVIFDVDNSLSSHTDNKKK